VWPRGPPVGLCTPPRWYWLLPAPPNLEVDRKNSVYSGWRFCLIRITLIRDRNDAFPSRAHLPRFTQGCQTKMPANAPDANGAKPPRLLDQLRAKTRLLHYSKRTEEAYVAWATKFILFHGKRHPSGMGVAEIEAFLTHLAVERKLAASTQNQAFSALLFLYQQVLGIELAKVEFLRAQRPERLPVVLAVDEVRAILDIMTGIHRVLVELLYGSGLRILECCRLRVKDLDFARHRILVRDGKGEKDRVVPLPLRLEPKLRAQLLEVKAIHSRDIAAGHDRLRIGSHH